MKFDVNCNSLLFENQSYIFQFSIPHRTCNLWERLIHYDNEHRDDWNRRHSCFSNITNRQQICIAIWRKVNILSSFGRFANVRIGCRLWHVFYSRQLKMARQFSVSTPNLHNFCILCFFARFILVTCAPEKYFNPRNSPYSLDEIGSARFFLVGTFMKSLKVFAFTDAKASQTCTFVPHWNVHSALTA